MENFDPCSVIKNLADVIAWNEQHADQALPKRGLDILSYQWSAIDNMQLIQPRPNLPCH